MRQRWLHGKLRNLPRPTQRRRNVRHHGNLQLRLRCRLCRLRRQHRQRLRNIAQQQRKLRRLWDRVQWRHTQLRPHDEDVFEWLRRRTNALRNELRQCSHRRRQLRNVRPHLQLRQCHSHLYCRQLYARCVRSGLRQLRRQPCEWLRNRAWFRAKLWCLWASMQRRISVLRCSHGSVHLWM